MKNWQKGFLLKAFLALIGLVGSACVSPARTPELPVSRSPVSPVEQASVAPLSVRLVQRFEEAGGSAHGPLQFGSGASLFGDTLAIGASERLAMDGYRKGRVFIYQRSGDGWALAGQLFASDKDNASQVDAEFGASLAMDENTIFAGAPGADDPEAGENSGAVYVFGRGDAGWAETGILKASHPRAGAGFGSSIKLWGDVLAVGEGYPGQTVIVFERQGQTWLEQARLTGENLGEKDVFGANLALDQNRLAISAIDYDPQSQRYGTGAVYVYQKRGQEWVQETKWTPEPMSMMGVGFSLDLEGNTLVVGAGGDTAAGVLAGAIYILGLGEHGWEQRARLVAGDGAFYTTMGSSVDLQGDLLVAGAGMDSSESFWSGSVYLFSRHGNTWIDALKLLPVEEDPQGAFFGSSVILSGSDLLVSAYDEYGGPIFLYALDGSR